MLALLLTYSTTIKKKQETKLNQTHNPNHELQRLAE